MNRDFFAKATPASGFNHPEAFCLMSYKCDACGRVERLWNSRDGVTPFIIRCVASIDGKTCGGEAQHVEWHRDQRAREFTPRNGQRFFRDLTREEHATWCTARAAWAVEHGHCDVAKQAELAASMMAGFTPGEPTIEAAP